MMKSIKRYNPSQNMIEDLNGEYVKIIDVLDLLMNSFKGKTKDREVDDILDKHFAKRKVKTKKLLVRKKNPK
jgi:hypothetical protein